jgi:hypothetical protein
LEHFQLPNLCSVFGSEAEEDVGLLAEGGEEAARVAQVARDVVALYQQFGVAEVDVGPVVGQRALVGSDGEALSVGQRNDDAVADVRVGFLEGALGVGGDVELLGSLYEEEQVGQVVDVLVDVGPVERTPAVDQFGRADAVARPY